MKYSNPKEPVLIKSLKKEVGKVEVKEAEKIEVEVEVKEAETSVEDYAFEPYNIRIAVPALNCRAGAGMEQKPIKIIADKGNYTVVEESKDSLGQKWGRLKEEGGWVRLEFTEKI